MLQILLLFNHLYLLFLFIRLLWHFSEIGVSFNYNKLGVGTVSECPPGFWRGEVCSTF